jgi:hypothetical protein
MRIRFGTLSIVMPGLDPGTHPLRKTMDRRVKPGNDGRREPGFQTETNLE